MSLPQTLAIRLEKTLRLPNPLNESPLRFVDEYYIMIIGSWIAALVSRDNGRLPSKRPAQASSRWVITLELNFDEASTGFVPPGSKLSTFVTSIFAQSLSRVGGNPLYPYPLSSAQPTSCESLLESILFPVVIAGLDFRPGGR
ncbi:hypothetical protein LENED_005983 [Lentinula edodes]|uniref:Uncharacterized protein n=1 Tax=Lentinula edodes TaxID=5353 RepID=A0A1Q3EAG1_LENED|nr:hypothetical protein LENED_005983 [Lentinula edodes]